MIMTDVNRGSFDDTEPRKVVILAATAGSSKQHGRMRDFDLCSPKRRRL